MAGYVAGAEEAIAQNSEDDTHREDDARSRKSQHSNDGDLATNGWRVAA